MMTTKKKFVLVPLGGVAIATSVAAAAFACTVFMGTLTLAGSTAGRVTVTGNRTGMSASISGTQASSGGAGTVQVSTGHPTNATGNKLPNKDSSGKTKMYYLKFFNGASYNGFNSNWQVDCMAGSSGPLMSEVTLNSSGGIATLNPGSSGSSISGGVVTLNLAKDFFGHALTNTANAGTTESAVCISDPGGAFGNQAPLTII